MNWDDTPAEAAFRTEVRQFIKDSFPAAYSPDVHAEQGLEPEDVRGYDWPADRDCADRARAAGAREWAAALAARGWIASRWPVEYGGAALPVAAEFVLNEELVRAKVPTVNSLGVSLLGPTLLRHGTAAQKATHLPPIARGERTWAQGFSEPDAGSDLAGLRTRAVRDGTYYVVNGRKVWTSLGQHADWLFILVRTGTDPAEPRHRGLTYLLVDARSEGVTVRPIKDMRGAEPFSEILFEDVRVPVADRVGEENRGWYVAMDTLSFERAAISTAVKLEQALTGLVDYVNSESGAGRLHEGWGSGIRAEVARRYTEVRVLYNVARYTVSRQAAGSVPGYEASVNQLFGAELHQRLAKTGARVFGQHSLMWRGDKASGAPLDGEFTHRQFDAVAATFLGGTSEIQRGIIATRGLGLPRA
ncbi:acyl-CoA dehydrogenase family protein [Amycolatopsis saalfeldensis]|uniref:Acyl-CoA dehydrogenase n=1 Tax=Amycolatopsis saalfeldensis TaxID=394193 RepID=A0A1H8YK14_9PSEU|nr:acyl-CoA dehydrogenase family protein [Amycolatopsis saalfeldensis]SEP52391.1 Acyl-CoA dehydrogenase [Amycolatopsis saalfeldensis]